MTSPAPRGRRFQVSLRTLFVLVALAAAFFAGWGLAERSARRAIQDANDDAETARLNEELVRRELEIERAPRYEPCHPGCFPAGTPVRVPLGTTPIERIRPGDLVVTIGADGQPTRTAVVSVFVTRNRLVTVRTDAGLLETTRTQPICLETGELRAAGDLNTGDTIWRWDGARRQAATVREVTEGRAAQVFNLVLGEPTVFVAGDFLVRSKPPAEADR
jgi:hypothetical protein